MIERFKEGRRMKMNEKTVTKIVGSLKTNSTHEKKEKGRKEKRTKKKKCKKEWESVGTKNEIIN